jgi:DNA-binding CsgD family transcriptional regulator
MAESGTRAPALEAARRAFERRAWSEAYGRLAAADREAPLGAEDVERLAQTAYLSGREAECEELLARAHHEFLAASEVERAARCAFWLANSLMARGEHARASGWLGRSERLLDDRGLDCVERGYLLLPSALRSVYGGDVAAAHALFTRAAEIAERFGDPDLAALARNGVGRTLIRLGDVEHGVALLDEAMAGVEAGEVSALAAGDVYCSVIEGCTEIFDLRRAQEWTASLSRWCDAQPDLVPFRGQCLIRRAEILQLRGAWDDALAEVRQARTRLSEPPPPRPAVGLALYQQGELHRLRGEFPEAEAMYREASHWSRKPRPGLALLRLAQGQVDAAAQMIRSIGEEARAPDVRPQVLAAVVEIMIAANDVATARGAAEELSAIAEELDSPYLHAVAAHATGAVLLARGDARGALTVLQLAWSAWQELNAPYQAARARALIAQACRRLGDEETAGLELEAATAVLKQLGAAPDLARIDRLARPAPGNAHGLTPRELEVLRLVARGSTNRAIAGALFISEKTVHRHVSNIFMKLGVSTRAAAAAFAFEHGLT